MQCCSTSHYEVLMTDTVSSLSVWKEIPKSPKTIQLVNNVTERYIGMWNSILEY